VRGLHITCLRRGIAILAGWRLRDGGRTERNGDFQWQWLVGDYIVSVSTSHYCETTSIDFSKTLLWACLRLEARARRHAEIAVLLDIQSSFTRFTSCMLNCKAQNHRRNDLVDADDHGDVNNGTYSLSRKLIASKL
jgi:hypothetical protein